MSEADGPCTFLGMEQKIVVLHGFSPDEAFSAMKALKGAFPGAADAAFCTTTETNIEWKLGYLVEHVTEEHQQFKEMQAKKAAEKGTAEKA